MEKCQPLNVKTVIVPKGQNQYGKDIVRFTADYCASDLFDMCIGCYPPCQSDLKGVVVVSDDDITYYPDGRIVPNRPVARDDAEPKKSVSLESPAGDPGRLIDFPQYKSEAPVLTPKNRRYWDV